ncbi:MAG TPA: alpha-galactosidase, partial [Caulobacteraceae bacterium]|nr:alpha-galactosidase [Caulobacteraceae bacterium]
MSGVVRLDGGGDTLLLQQTPGAPRLIYWGEALLDDAIGAEAMAERVTRGTIDGGEVFDLFPEAGRGFTGQPAFEHHRDDGGFVSQLKPVNVEVQGQCATFRLADDMAGVEAMLTVELDADTGVASFRSRIVNRAAAPLHLDWVAAAALPLGFDELVLFDGRWAREFQTARQRLGAGMLVRENRTGRTSHHSPPFLLAGEPGFGEHSGEVLGLHFAWSGNHRLLVERLRDGRMQAQAGAFFWPGELTLGQGETYETPTLYAARSSIGTNGLTHRFHPFVRTRILGGRLARKPRPVNFNTWEAVYFRHDLAELKTLADAAADIGAERFVLDDGWFKGRPDDTAGLGDWTPDPAKYPNGLTPLIEHVHSLGLAFGLWVEPEMANADSDLLRAHPDWILGVAGRKQPLGRNQYVLDLTRAEVFENLYAQIDDLLSGNAISYLKWDMNRDLMHPASGGRAAAHRQTLAVYALVDRLRAAHPAVEIEDCSSGGGRADFEMLKRTDRIWLSDCNDPIERQAMQRAFTIFFPPEVMGSHVAATADHTTGRRSSMEFRALTALFGHMGIEADVRAFTESERAALKRWIAAYKDHRALIHSGRLSRQTVSDPAALAFMIAGETEVLASYAQLGVRAKVSPDPLRLKGLDPAAVYRVAMIAPAASPIVDDPA